MIPLILLSFLFAFLSGVSRGFHHARRDYSMHNKAQYWIKPSARYWALGYEWNQSYLWTADHCHQMILLQCLFWALSGMCLAFADVPWYAIVIWLPLVYNEFEPQGFALFYKVILPDSPSIPQYSLWTWIVGWVKFW